MKKIILILLITHCSIIIAEAQWMNQVSGTTRTLYDIEFLNKNTGWVVGVGGIIKKTTDGGQNWLNVPHPVGGRLLSSIHIVDSNVAYVVGDFETIIKTTDGGSNWNIIRYGTLGQGSSYEGVFFVNKDTGWICGNGQYVLKTTNGGLDFDSSYVFWGILSDMFFKDNVTGVMCGWAGGTFKTTDAGLSWFRTPVPLPTNQPTFRKVCFINNETGWIAGGDGRVFRTTNFGSTWDSIAFLNTLPVVMYCAEFVNSTTGWVAGEEGVIYKTTNAGQNWGIQYSGTNNLITSLWFYNDSLGWASCGFGSILNTINGGLTSINQQATISNEFRLYQNFPNPFNPTTIINYELENSNFVSFKVYDILGNTVANLVEKNQEAGFHSVKWDAEIFSTGIYFYRITIGDFSESKKMILQK